MKLRLWASGEQRRNRVTLLGRAWALHRALAGEQVKRCVVRVGGDVD